MSYRDLNNELFQDEKSESYIDEKFRGIDTKQIIPLLIDRYINVKYGFDMRTHKGANEAREPLQIALNAYISQSLDFLVTQFEKKAQE